MAEDPTTNTFRPFYNPFYHPPPILVHQHCNSQDPTVFAKPFTAPLLFDNNDSDARDHCANERTFLSYLRLSLYLGVVALALGSSFHLAPNPTSSPTPPSKLEKSLALPLGIFFWTLALVCLCNGFARYCHTVRGYGRRQAVVQAGVWTTVVFTIVAVSIVGASVLFLSMEGKRVKR